MTDRRLVDALSGIQESNGTDVSAGEVLISAKGVTKSFFKGSTEVSVLRGVDLDIHSGEMLTIVGASGVGKSTFLHILGTLEPPTAGRVLFGQAREDIFACSEKALSVFRNRTLGFVFQFHYLLPEFSALENVMMPALIGGHPRSAAVRYAKELLDFVGLSHRLDHRPAELSGGEQQRVAVARSVILKPRILMADELTGNLDSSNRDLIMDLLVRLNEETGISVLLVTHDREIAQRTHRVLRMKDGKLVD